MERIKVKIEKLGRVVNSEIEIAPLMIFSGESGMGKSYLALLSHYFFDLLILPERDARLPRLFDYLHYDYYEMVKSFQNEGEAFTITKRAIEEWMEEDAVNYLKLMLNSESLDGKIRITLPSSIPDSVVCYYREEYTGLVNSEDVDIILSMGNIAYRSSHKAINDTTPYAAILSAFLRDGVFGDIHSLYATFNMPPSRGPVMSENVVANSGMYRDFIYDITDLSNVQSDINGISSSILNQLHSIMEGDIKKENNRFMYHTNGTTMPISAAASSVREIAPLQLLASKWDIRKTAILIEEPEAHLHPSKQRMIADIIGCLRKTGAYIHLTTHSDYFLHRINELIMFQRYVDGHDSDSIRQLEEKTGISREFSIDSADMVAYLVKRQDNGSSVVISQDMKYGVPFTSFNDAVEEGVRVNNLLEEALGL